MFDTWPPPTQVVTTVAGIAGTCIHADGALGIGSFLGPINVALSIDEATLYVADYNSHTIRAVHLADGSIITVAGIPGGNDSRCGIIITVAGIPVIYEPISVLGSGLS